MGAIRPPWITKEDFYRTPFNFCDRWCERCRLTSICTVYKENEKDKKRALKEGKDPNSWEFTFEVLRKNFRKISTMIARDAKRLGIDMDELMKADESEQERYEAEKERLNDHPLYILANRWSDYIHAFLKQFTEVPIETSLNVAVETREVLNWYQTLIPAKVYRALSGLQEEIDNPEKLRTYDDKTSALIAYNGLMQASEALVRLASERVFRQLKRKCLLLSQKSLDLAHLLSETFHFETNSK